MIIWSLLPVCWMLLLQTVFAGQIDMVRIEDGKYSRDVIYQQKTGQWGKPVNLTRESRTDDYTPVAMRLADQTVLVMWKELTGVDASNLNYSLIDVDDSDKVASVGEIRTIDTQTAHQASPTLLRDNDGTIWGFWVGFNGREDDIYYATFGADGWSTEQRIYDKDNEVPDLRPTARLNISGQVEIRWRQYNFQSGGYIDVFSAIKPGEPAGSVSWTKPQPFVPNPLEKTPTLPDDFVLPDGIGYPQSVALHFSSLPAFSLHLDQLRPDVVNATTD